MITEKVKKLVANYLGDFKGWGEARRYSGREYVEIHDQVEQAAVPSHVLWMLGQMMGMDDHDKLNRWMGFVQGVLWVIGIRSINELRIEIIKAEK